MAFELFCCECEGQIFPYQEFKSKDENAVFASAVCRKCWSVLNA